MGPSERPWGTLWSSIGLWGEDALEMAGVTEYDQWTTHLSTAYELNDQLLYEIGTFTLRTNYTTPYSVPSRCHNYSGQVPHKIWDSDNNDYVECKTMDEYWERLRNNRIKAGTLPKDDVEHLPPSLKKNTQIRVLEPENGQENKVIETSIQCNGCDGWGNVVEDYADDPQGIVQHASIDQYLCYQCSCFWGQQTGAPRSVGSHVEVPALSLNMEY